MQRGCVNATSYCVRVELPCSKSCPAQHLGRSAKATQPLPCFEVDPKKNTSIHARFGWENKPGRHMQCIDCIGCRATPTSPACVAALHWLSQHHRLHHAAGHSLCCSCCPPIPCHMPYATTPPPHHPSKHERTGFPVQPMAAFDWSRGAALIAQQGGPGARALIDEQGRAPRAGQLWRNPDLAATYRRIGKLGAAQGEVVCCGSGMCVGVLKGLWLYVGEK